MGETKIINAEKVLSPLTALTPLDGRYRSKVEALATHFSELALIRERVDIEARWFVTLSDFDVIRKLDDSERNFLLRLGPALSFEQAERVKEIEGEIRHDVKAMERTFRELLKGTSLESLTEMVHFTLTSEDVSNLAYRSMLRTGLTGTCIPLMNSIVDKLAEMAGEYKAVPMIGRTHGQPAVPTTLGKEIINFAERLNNEIAKLEDAESRLTGKVTGAVGNLNSLVFAVPEVNPLGITRFFVNSMGFKPNIFTTQINPYEDIIEVLQAVQRVNNVIIGLDQDMWRYISDNWLAQQVKKGEVGSSTMPQKVNPQDFENSEGNLPLANGLIEVMARTLPISRLQRHLSDSTMIRNIGTVLGYSLVGYQGTFDNLGRLSANMQVIAEKLNENWNILGEAVQTLLRREGAKDPYSMVATLSKGQKITKDGWVSWINGLDGISQESKERLATLSPETYIGEAIKLTEMALEEIAHTREHKRAR